MADTQVTTQDSLSPTMVTYYDKKLLARLLPLLVHMKWAQKRPIPKHGGKTINFRSFSPLAHATTPLTEGVTPAGNSLTITEIEATVSQYGDFIEVSDVLDLTAIDPILDETADLLGEQAAQTLDIIARDVLNAGTTVQRANGRVNRSDIESTDLLTVDEIRKGVRTLKRNNVKSINGYYIAIVEPGTTYDLQSDEKWEDASKYAGSTQIFSGEIGRIYGVRFVETTYAKKFDGEGKSGLVDVYSTLIFGQNAYGMSDIESSGAVKNIIKPHGSGGTSDPLNQRATSGWKAMFVVKILQQLAILRIEHAVSG